MSHHRFHPIQRTTPCESWTENTKPPYFVLEPTGSPSRLQVIPTLVLPQKMELKDLKADCRNCVCSALNTLSFPITVTDHSADGREMHKTLIDICFPATVGPVRTLATQLDYCDPLRAGLCVWQG